MKVTDFYRILPESYSPTELLHTTHLHSFILILCDISTVLAAEVDGVTRLTDEILYRRIPYPFTASLGSHEWFNVVSHSASEYTHTRLMVRSQVYSYVDCANVR